MMVVVMMMMIAVIVVLVIAVRAVMMMVWGGFSLHAADFDPTHLRCIVLAAREPHRNRLDRIDRSPRMVLA
jgi:hypothetical protein